MFVSLEQIEFYHGPPRQQFQKRMLSPARRKQSSTFAVTEPIRRSVPTESVFTPGSHAYAIPPNGPEPTALQPCDKPSTSIGEAWNVFDVELAHLDHGKGGAQRQGSGPPEGNDRSCPNDDDRGVQPDEDEACHHNYANEVPSGSKLWDLRTSGSGSRFRPLEPESDHFEA